MTQKEKYLEDGVRLSENLAQVCNELVILRRTAYHCGFDSGGADPLTDQDCEDAGYDITAAVFGQILTTAQKLDDFMDTGAGSAGDYYGKIDAIRYAKKS